MDLKRFKAYTLDTNDESAQEIVSRSSRAWNEKVLRYLYQTEGNVDVATQLCSMVQDNFECLSMKEGQNGEPFYFQEITDWKEMYVINSPVESFEFLTDSTIIAITRQHCTMEELYCCGWVVEGVSPEVMSSS